jgi:hypothetical protein
MNGIFANYLWTMFWGSLFWIFWIMWFFPRKYKYGCIRVYVWFKDDKHVILMWIWLILKNISLLDRIWWVIFGVLFWLGKLIFSVSINSHPYNIYLFSKYNLITSFIFLSNLVFNMLDLRMIHMSSECEYDWYWKNISLLDTIWSLWLVRFAHSSPNFIFLLGRLIFSVSINSHPDNIYLFSKYNLITSFIFLSNLVFNIRAVPDH